jgi:hypothetical protein
MTENEDNIEIQKQNHAKTFKKDHFEQKREERYDLYHHF